MNTKQEHRDSFILYKSFFDPISKFTDEQLGRLFRAIFKWQNDGRSEPDQDIEVAFGFFVNQFRIDNEKYQERCEKNRENAQSRWNMRTDANGCERIQSGANDADNDNENDNDNGNENVLLEQSEKQTESKREISESDLLGDVDKRRKNRRKNGGNGSFDDVEDSPNIRHENKHDAGMAKVDNDPLILPFNDPEFVDTWNELIKQPKWRNKPKSALKLALKQLSSFHNAEFAVYLMEIAIAGNYQGVVFPNTKSHYYQWLANYRQWKQARQQSTPPNTPGKVIRSFDEAYPD